MEVEKITNRDVDFAQWYTDVCMSADLVDYSTVKGSKILTEDNELKEFNAE